MANAEAYDIQCLRPNETEWCDLCTADEWDDTAYAYGFDDLQNNQKIALRVRARYTDGTYGPYATKTYTTSWKSLPMPSVISVEEIDSQLKFSW